MSFISSLYARLVSWYGKRTVIGVVTLTLALITAGLFLKFGGGNDEEVVIEAQKRAVSVELVSSMSTQSGTLSILGQVESTREARLVTEAGGRVTSVTVKLGDMVRAGTVLATIENSRERAVVLQAQGSYEAAQAASNSGNASIVTAERSLEEAKTNAVNTYRSSYTTADAVVRNTADQVFFAADSVRPGLLINAAGKAPVLSIERVAIGDMLNVWREKSLGLSQNDVVNLEQAERDVKRISELLSILATLYANDDRVRDELSNFGPELAVARAQINGVLSSISGTRSALIGAENAVTQARIAGESGRASASDAQIKQALGSLRLAQANLEKTIVRSPIAGTVQSISVKEGSTVPQGSPAAIVSSEGSLEVVAYINESDARLIGVGDTVSIENGANGVVTEIATAIDPTTKKIQLRIGITDGSANLTNGQAVTVGLMSSTNTSDTTSVPTVTLPIIALKMTPDGAVVFTVEAGKLVSHSVTLGAIIGDRVVIENGIDTSWLVVTDARGLRAGEEVEVN